jgi:hypothetical protein
METSIWKPEYTARAREIWEEFQRRNDLSAQTGKVAAIDPVSGRVWIDESGVDVAEQMALEGVNSPVYLVRVGYGSYVRKRWCTGRIPELSHA